jgi:hypothetical protein
MASRLWLGCRLRRRRPAGRRGQSGIYAADEKANVAAEREVTAVDYHRDGRQDKRVRRHRHATPVANHRLTQWRDRLLVRLLLIQAPTVDVFDVESPIATHVKRRNLIALHQTVDRGWMHAQVS